MMVGDNYALAETFHMAFSFLFLNSLQSVSRTIKETCDLLNLDLPDKSFTNGWTFNIQQL